MTTLRRRLLGVAMIASVVAFLGLTVATYQKAFTPTVDVVLNAEAAGNQLLPDSDVKVRGVIVGQVREIDAVDGGAQMKLALDPDKVEHLPSNVSARLLPKTLFGERYVALQLPEDASSEPLAAGAVIEQDRSKQSIELENVLADTMPVLQAVHPDDLAVTLNAMSQALDGRGKPLGETLTQLNDYLEQLNPSLPDLRNNLRELVGFAQTYEEAAPDIVAALKNFTTTSRTLVAQRQNLTALTSQLTTTADETTSFLAKNRENMIRLGESQRPTLDVFAKHSPAFPCFLDDMEKAIGRIDGSFGKGTDEPGLHITLEVVHNRGKYEPGEEPEFVDQRGARCYPPELNPKPFPQYPPESHGGPVDDGSNPPPATGNGKTPPGSPPPVPEQGGASPAGTSSQFASTELGYVNSPMERDFVSALLAPTMRSGEAPQWGSLLVGPVLRGAEVSYR